MTEKDVMPEIGETWELKLPLQDWVNVLILEAINNADGTKTFVSAKIITTELPVNYSGLNVEINDGGFSSNICSSFVVYLDNPQNLDVSYFKQKRGKLKNEDWTRAENNYLDYKRRKESQRGKKN